LLRLAVGGLEILQDKQKIECDAPC
jgi:hypothetical protein